MSQNFKIIEVAGHRFVAGMFWQVLENGDRAKEDIKKIAEEGGYDHECVISNTSHLQIGFCGSADHEGNKVDGTYSLAASLRETITEDSWAGIFKVSDDLWCYVAVREGYMLPEGDMWANSPEDLVRQFDIDSALGGWGAVYGPEGLIDRSIATSLEDLLADRPSKQCKIETHGVKIPWKTLGIGTLVILALGSVFYGYELYQEKQRALALAKAAAAARARAAQMPVIPQEPWNEEPSPSMFASRCFDTLSGQRVVFHGWKMGSAECTKAGIRLTFVRAGGSVPDITSLYHGVEISDTGEAAQVMLPFTESKKRIKEDIRNYAEARETLFTLEQRLGLTAPIIGDSSAPPPSTTQAAMPVAGNVAPIAFAKFGWSMTSSFAPVEIARALDGVHGVTINTLKLETTNFTWNFKGDLYGKK